MWALLLARTGNRSFVEYAIDELLFKQLTGGGLLYEQRLESRVLQLLGFRKVVTSDWLATSPNVMEPWVVLRHSTFQGYICRFPRALAVLGMPFHCICADDVTKSNG